MLLGQFVEQVPQNGSVLELGTQNIEPGVQHESVISCARKIHRGESAARQAADRYDGTNRCPISELFRGSQYRYRCLDLYNGEFTIVADLNKYVVQEKERCTFDLVTNVGTTEHVTD